MSIFEEQAAQCGYCIPGMVMAATSAIRANPHVSDAEIKERLGGNICRCTGYQHIVDAVKYAAEKMKAAKAEPMVAPGFHARVTISSASSANGKPASAFFRPSIGRSASPTPPTGLP